MSEVADKLIELFPKASKDNLDTYILPELTNNSYLIGATTKQQKAYILATIAHETWWTMEPIEERISDKAAEKHYGYQTKAGEVLGNRYKGDGALYKGRGYIQLTGRDNYTRCGYYIGVDLENSPERALEPKIAARLAVDGMCRGLFTGRKLSQYINTEHIDYYNARRTVNGVDRAQKIAELASKIEAVL